MKLLLATSTCFCRHKITFCATSNFLFRHKIAFSATPNFCFGHRFRMSCLGDVFLFSHSNKNIIMCEKKKKISFLCDTKKLISFLLHHKFFIYSVFTLYNGSMLIFFVVVLETKKLLIHLLLTCLMYRSSY